MIRRWWPFSLARPEVPAAARNIGSAPYRGIAPRARFATVSDVTVLRRQTRNRWKRGIDMEQIGRQITGVSGVG